MSDVFRCKVDGGFCDGEGLVCRLNPLDKGKTFRNLGDVEDRPFFNRLCSNFGGFVGFDFHGYEHDSSVDMSGYVPLSERRSVAWCRCPICSPSESHVICHVDGLVCFHESYCYLERLGSRGKRVVVFLCSRLNDPNFPIDFVGCGFEVKAVVV